MTAALGNPFALGAGSTVQTSARTDRLSLGAVFRPGAAALSATSGMLIGPTGTMGALTLLSDSLLRVDPFIAVVQGTHNAAQGQYVVPNAAQRDLAVPAKDATLFRRALIVVRVADSLEAGVGTSATTDGSWLEIISGTAVASSPALPATPNNALLLGELSIPSSGSGQPVTLTPYNPRTISRGGVLPVYDDALTYPGHGGAAGTYVDEYRSHPTRGLERWTGSVWGAVTEVPTFASIAARNAFYGASNPPRPGTVCKVTGYAFQTLHHWDAVENKWRFRTAGYVNASAQDFIVAHSGGQTPTKAGAQVNYTVNDAISAVSKLVLNGIDATNLTFTCFRTDSNVRFNTILTFYWYAEF